MMNAIGSAVYGFSGPTPSDPPLPETWHQVGQPGEPAFSPPWTNVGGVDLTVRFRRGIQDDVQLAGRARTTAAVGLGSLLFTLPAAYAPATRIILPVAINNPSTMVVLAIGTDGRVTLLNISGSVTVNSLDLTGLSYPLTA